MMLYKHASSWPADNSAASVHSGIMCKFYLQHGKLSCETMNGTAELAVEFCEVLCWLSVACRGNDDPVIQPEICVPQVIELSEDHLIVRPTYSALKQDECGTCWQSIFWNTAVTMGYPIPTRHPGVQGLEIDLELMTGLTLITRATMYGEILMLKGLCNMFVPTLAVGNSIVWHYLLNDDFSWMSHNHAEKSCKSIASIGFDEMKSATRHFVGWTTASRLNLGERFHV